MPAYQLRLAEPQEEREELEQQFRQLVQECPEIKSTPRNHIKRFLMEYGVYRLSEIDYSLRLEYEGYLKGNKVSVSAMVCLHVFDRIKLYTMRKEMQTMAGRKKYVKYADKVLFLPYYPELEIAEQFIRARDKEGLVWDFSRQCSRQLKKQIFICLNNILSTYENWERKEKLKALQDLYGYCEQMGIEDLECMTLEQEKGFVDFLPSKLSKRKAGRIFGIIELCRKTLFLYADQIHWYAQVWYMERFHFTKERLNPSKMVVSISFREISHEGNKKYLKEYMRYALGITDVALSSIQTRFFEIRKFLQAVDEEERNVCELSERRIQSYIGELRKKEVDEKTFNGQLFGILHFFNFLMVKGYIKRIPFHYKMYQKKVNPVHHDRSVREEVCEEILSKLYQFPEHLRLMFLHLWCVGLRCSEICTLEGDAYEWKDGDAWVKVYQIKMKTYKRVPIPEMLYRLMRVYIRKYQIQPGEYLFKNKNGEAYAYTTFRKQMLKLCSENQIDGGEYLFKSHDYRHAVATEDYESGVSIQAVRDYLGHDHEDMTRQYIDYMPRRLDAANEKFFCQQSESLAAGLMKGDKDGK